MLFFPYIFIVLFIFADSILFDVQLLIHSVNLTSNLITPLLVRNWTDEKENEPRQLVISLVFSVTKIYSKQGHLVKVPDSNLTLPLADPKP